MAEVFSLCRRRFQSTLPRRERQGQGQQSRERKNISIHAPTKGATRSVLSSSDRLCNFNPRSHEGSDKKPFMVSTIYFAFQSTLPRRERRQAAVDQVLIFDISIHAPTKGATGSERDGAERIEISIHAPTKGATGSATMCSAKNRISIHAPTKGATGVEASADRVCRHFNPRSHEGSDKSVRVIPDPGRISIHAPTKGATVKIVCHLII